MKNLSAYDRIKIVVYVIGLILTIYLITDVGLIDSHTAPPGFVLALFFMFLGILWYFVDRIVIHFSSVIQIKHTINIFGIYLNFIIVIWIIIRAL